METTSNARESGGATTRAQERPVDGAQETSGTLSRPEERPPEPAVRVIAATRRRLSLIDLIHEWPVIRVLAARDFKVKYKQSALGPLWLVIQPLALLGAFFVAFQGLADVESSGYNYAAFALVGLTVWSFFQAAMLMGTSAVITNAIFVRLTPCPRLAFPVAAILASIPAFAVTAAGAIVVSALTGDLSPRVVLLPLGLVWLLLLTAGILGITSAIAVPYRDVISALPFLLQVALFLAPVGYALSSLSDSLRTLVSINPVSGLIEATRWIMLDGYAPSFEPIAVSLAGTAVLLVVGWRVFTRLEPTMADVI